MHSRVLEKIVPIALTLPLALACSEEEEAKGSQAVKAEKSEIEESSVVEEVQETLSTHPINDLASQEPPDWCKDCLDFDETASLRVGLSLQVVAVEWLNDDNQYGSPLDARNTLLRVTVAGTNESKSSIELWNHGYGGTLFTKDNLKFEEDDAGKVAATHLREKHIDNVFLDKINPGTSAMGHLYFDLEQRPFEEIALKFGTGVGDKSAPKFRLQEQALPLLFGVPEVCKQFVDQYKAGINDTLADAGSVSPPTTSSCQAQVQPLVNDLAQSPPGTADWFIVAMSQAVEDSLGDDSLDAIIRQTKTAVSGAFTTANPAPWKDEPEVMASPEDGAIAGASGTPEGENNPASGKIQLVDAMDAMADDYCDCDDVICIEEVQDEWDEREGDIEGDENSLSASEQERMGEAMGRMMNCMMAVGMSGQ
jgi:hypothetical protein